MLLCKEFEYIFDENVHYNCDIKLLHYSQIHHFSLMDRSWGFMAVVKSVIYFGDICGMDNILRLHALNFSPQCA